MEGGDEPVPVETLNLHRLAIFDCAGGWNLEQLLANVTFDIYSIHFYVLSGCHLFYCKSANCSHITTKTAVLYKMHWYGSLHEDRADLWPASQSRPCTLFECQA